jgi:hypothetical protein
LKRLIEGKMVEEVVTDNGREFCNSVVKNMLDEGNIKHRTVSVESHRSNGRVERIIRTLREGLERSK